MEYTYYDTEFISSVKEILDKNNIEIVDADFYIEKINEIFPFIGSKIDFSKLKKNKYIVLEKKILEEATSFINSIIQENKLDLREHLIYVGDGLTGKAYKFYLRDLTNILPYILDIPQHHYIISEKYSWGLNISFENEISFGML